MAINVSSIFSGLVVIVGVVVFGYIFVKGFKGNSEMHGVESGNKKTTSTIQQSATSTKTEEKG